MPVRADTYAPDRPVPYLLEVGYASLVLDCPIRATGTGAIVPVTSGRLTLTDPNGTDLVSSAVADISSSGVPSRAVTLAAGATLGEGYDAVWVLLIDGKSYTFRLPGIACKYVPPNVITAADLFGGEGIPELRFSVPQAQGPKGDNTGWAPQIDAAYYQFVRRLLADGRPIWRLREATGYRDYLLALAVKNATDAVPASGVDSPWAVYRRDAYHRLKRAEAGLRLQYDDEAPGVRRAGSPVIRLAPLGRPLW